jgi:hypothetical protein
MNVVDLSKATTALVVNFHKVGNRRKVSSQLVEVDAAKEWISVSKRILEGKELEAISSCDNRVRKYLEARALPSMLKKGIYLMPNGFVVEVDAKLKEFVAEREALVQKFIKAYKRIVAEAKEALAGLFDQIDYPEAEELGAMFFLKWRYISFNTPASLEHISAEIYAEEKEKAQAQWVEATDAIQKLLRANMAELVNHLVEKLTPSEDGKKKKFKNATIDRLSEFLQTFRQRNVTNDSELEKLVSDAEKLIAGTNPDLLRSDDAARELAQKGFAKIAAAMSPMIEETHKRKIKFQDED